MLLSGPITTETGTRVGFYTANGIIERTDDTLLYEMYVGNE